MIKFFKVPTQKDLFEPCNIDYRVYIDGQECPVYNARVSAVPYNGYGGMQRPLEQTEMAAFVRITADESLKFVVEFANDPSEYPQSVLTGLRNTMRSDCIVRPLEKKIQVKENSNRAEFTLTESGTYILEPYGRHCVLHIFVDAPRGYSKSGATYYFGEGIHFPGVIRLKSGDRVFIDNGAVVFGSLLAHDAHDVKVYGEGVLDGSYEERLTPHCYEDYTKGNIRLYNCQDVSVEGIVLRNSAIWSFSMYESESIVVDNVKSVGQWRYNTDGIDLVNCRNVLIKNSFIRSFDDSVCLKAIDSCKGNVSDIYVSGCTLWCDWGRTLEIGLETACDEYARILFENCFLVHNSVAALDVQGGNYAHIHDVTFRDISVEFEYGALPERMQTSSAEYDAQGNAANPVLIAVVNPSMLEMEMYQFLFTPEQLKDGRRSVIDRVYFEDIRVYFDEGVNMPAIRVCSFYDGFEFSDISIENISFNGKRVRNAGELNLTLSRVNNFSLK